MKDKGDENKKLEEKVKNLCEKILNEDNIAKRYEYEIYCKILVTKMKRNIKLKDAKEELDRQKEENKITAKEEKEAIRSKIIKTNEQISELRKELKFDIHYDYESPRFMFEKEGIEDAGGIYEFIQELLKSEDPEQVEIAKRLQEHIDKKAELNVLERRLKEQQNELKNINKDITKKNFKISAKEVALDVRDSKLNIFTKVRNFVSNTVSGIKEFATEAFHTKIVENIKVHKAKKKTIDYIYEKFWDRWEKIDEEAKNEKIDLLKELKEAKKYANGLIDEKKKRANEARKNKKVNKFKEELKQMTQNNSNNSIEGKEEIDGERDNSRFFKFRSKEEINKENTENETKYKIDKNFSYDENKINNLCEELKRTINGDEINTEIQPNTEIKENEDFEKKMQEKREQWDKKMQEEREKWDEKMQEKRKQWDKEMQEARNKRNEKMQEKREQWDKDKNKENEQLDQMGDDNSKNLENDVKNREEKRRQIREKNMQKYYKQIEQMQKYYRQEFVDDQTHNIIKKGDDYILDEGEYTVVDTEEYGIE